MVGDIALYHVAYIFFYLVGQDPYGSFGGQIISATKDACRSAFLACPVRLVEAMYRCIIQAPCM